MSFEHYPAAPTSVPEGLTVAPASYRRNVWLAVAGLLGFVVAYAALTGWFAYKAFTLLRDAWQGGSQAFLGFATGTVAAFLAVFLGKAMFFVRSHADSGRIEITESDEPQLFAFLRRLAAETGAKAPYRVYLSPRVNAAVFYDLSLLNLLLPSRKNLEIGVGLVNVLTLAEFKAVLAHELGHFAQRSMAVGRWVYISQQIVGQIVAKRDIFDRFLHGLSHTDLRIAWIGWGLRIIVWSIRSVLDSLFGVIVVAERALSREMELQADLVSVSVAGSDALVHALRKLPAADAAWDSALEIFARELGEGRLADLCAMQTRILECTRRVLADPLYGAVPPLPEAGHASHRVFQPGLCQAPQMWSTHPPSHVREDNAKRRYVPAPLDDRPAWLVFADDEAVKRRVVDRVADLAGRPDKLETIDRAASLAAVDRGYQKLFLDPRYRGAYLGRCITRTFGKSSELCAPSRSEREAVCEALRGLYPESLSEAVGRARAQAKEVAQLEAIQHGVATAPGGVIRYGGQEYRRRELKEVIARAKQDHANTLAALREHDRNSRSVHRDAAALLGHGWPEYLDSLHALLHYAEHSEANVDDAGGHLQNVVAIVTADGKVSSGEARRLIVSGGDLQYALQQVFEQRTAVRLPAAVMQRLEVESWQAMLPTNFELTQPHEETLGSFMNVVDSWFQAFSGALGALRGATLDALLATEAQVARALLDGAEPEAAPEPGRVPRNYIGFCHGQERERQHRLHWWDRFVLADGIGPGLARLVVAGGVVGMVVGFGGSVGTPTVVIHNGLGRDVVVTIADKTVHVPGHGRNELQISGSHVPVRAETTDQREIESFMAEVDNPMGDYVYNIGGASPMAEWTAVYGSSQQPAPRPLGAPRWFATKADDILVDPPTRSSDTTREVLSAGDEASIIAMFGILGPAEFQRVALFHARWEPLDGVEARWLMAADSEPEFPAVLQARLAAGESSVLLGRLEQDTGDEASHRAVCERHRSAAAAAPGDADAAYLAARCIDDEALKDARFLELDAQHPGHPWIGQAAAHAYFGRDEFDAAIAGIEAAIRQIPATAEDNTLLLARLRRRARPDVTVDNSPLVEKSLPLEYFIALEEGKPFNDSPVVTAYRELDAGRLGDALDQAPSDARARVLRLVAASDGADPALVKQIGEFGPDDGIDASTVWTALAYATAHDLPVAPYVEKVREVAATFAETMLRFVDRKALLADLAGAQQAMQTLQPDLRGYAAVMGIITLGAEAPAAWRVDARTLLFASERPYFVERVEPPPVAEVEAPSEPPKRGKRGKSK